MVILLHLFLLNSFTSRDRVWDTRKRFWVQLIQAALLTRQLWSKFGNYSSEIPILLLLCDLLVMACSTAQREACPKLNFRLWHLLLQLHSLAHWLSSVHNKGQNQTEYGFYYCKKKMSGSGQHGKGTLSLHTSISRWSGSENVLQVWQI